ncbi:hypothetical protein ABZ726_23885 [Streptomyces hundungensis]|uniref:hypothetical protein n=1 Tax=Streptomyces hundungensis TaxID=1077946 RepID=UPI0033F3DBB3
MSITRARFLLRRLASKFHQWMKSPVPQIRHARTLFTAVKSSVSMPLIEVRAIRFTPQG